MKLGPVTKLDNRIKTTSKKSDDEFMLEYCEVIAIFPIYNQFEATRKPDSRGTNALIVIFYLTKIENRTKKITKAALTLV